MHALIEDAIFLPIIFFLGIINSYSDLKCSKIRNRWIVSGLFLGLICYIFLFFWGNLSPFYLEKLLFNTLSAMFVSYIIWYFRLWAAGDGKLFILFSFLIPLKYYDGQRFIPFFPSFILLVNIFIIVLCFLLLDFCFKIILGLKFYLNNNRSLRKSLFRGYPNSKEKKRHKMMNFLKVIFGYMYIFLIIRLLSNELTRLISFAPFLVNLGYIILFLSYRPVSMFLEKTMKIIWIPTILSFAYVLFFVASRKSILLEIATALKYFFSFMGLLFIFRTVLRLYVEKNGVKQIEIEALKPKMLLAEKSIKALDSIALGKLYPDGLTKEQVEVIQKNWLIINHNEAKIAIYPTFPFAPFIFLGVIITIIVKAYILKFLGLN